MNKKELIQLGITEKDVLDKLVERLVANYVSDGEYKTDFENRIEAAVRKVVDAKIEAAFKKQVAPIIAQMADEIVLQETNRWGEKTGKKQTFTEYLVARADAYIREEVDYEGKPKTSDNSYNWKAKGTRIAHLIHAHLHYNIIDFMNG